jgi:hypothetical protein
MHRDRRAAAPRACRRSGDRARPAAGLTRAGLLRWATVVGAGAFLGLRPPPARAQAPPEPGDAASEAGVKAAYLLRFIGFVEWPDSAFAGPEAPLRLGVLDADGVAAELAALARGRLLGRRPIVAQRMRSDEGVSGLHAVFVGRDSSPRLPALIAGAAGQPLLTVSENGDAPVPGSVITFVVVDGKVRFDVVLPMAEALHIKISARLLPVARRVLPGG